MADTKISNETTASTLTGAEIVLGVQGGVNVKIPLTMVLAYMQLGGVITFKGDFSLAGNLFPGTAVKKGYQYYITASSTTLVGHDGGIIPIGSSIVARIDSPSTTSYTDWLILMGQY
jgi:hypothetical protein